MPLPTGASPTDLTGAYIRQRRQDQGWSQAHLASQLGVSQTTISNWESGTTIPSAEDRARLGRVFAIDLVEGSPEPEQQAYGDWVYRQRTARALSRQQLADQVGISPIQIYNIETGRTANPRGRTRQSLERALGPAPQQVVEEVAEASRIADLGQLEGFDPHVEEDAPSGPGVYVFYDISDRVIYVGQSGNIRNRIWRGPSGHQSQFWYKRPIVQSAAFVRVDDEGLRKQLEATLIKFLRSHAVINKLGVDRSG